MVQNLPLWLDEGLAKYFEVPRGTHGLNTKLLDELNKQARQGRWRPDIHRLESIRSPADMTEIDYAEAWAWVHWMLESDPVRKSLLQDYLADLRRTGAPAQLSLYLARLGGDPEQDLFAYIVRLNGGQQSTSRLLEIRSHDGCTLKRRDQVSFRNTDSAVDLLELQLLIHRPRRRIVLHRLHFNQAKSLFRSLPQNFTDQRQSNSLPPMSFVHPHVDQSRRPRTPGVAERFHVDQRRDGHRLCFSEPNNSRYSSRVKSPNVQASHHVRNGGSHVTSTRIRRRN